MSEILPHFRRQRELMTTAVVRQKAAIAPVMLKLQETIISSPRGQMREAEQRKFVLRCALPKKQNAEGGIRTPTPVTGDQALNLARLPVPPPPQIRITYIACL